LRPLGNEPEGLKLSKAGHLSGKVKAKTDPSGRPYTFTVKVTDHTKKAKQSATATFTLELS
jgi:hypothetical protein